MTVNANMGGANMTSIHKTAQNRLDLERTDNLR